MSIELPQFGDPKRTLFEYHPVLRNGEVRTVGSIAQTVISDAKTNLSAYSDSRYDRVHNRMGERGFWDGFWEEAGSDYAALHLGVAVQSLEGTIINGEFDFAHHIATFNEAVVGLWHLQRRKIPESKIIPVTNKKLREMRAAVKEDPTFASFFGTKRNLLPRQLRAFLHMTYVMTEIEKIIPAYQEYAGGVISGYNQTEKDVLEHGAVLSYYDDLIAKLDDSQS